MAYWTLEDIAWQEFNASKIDPEHLALIKAACMVEHNGDAYAQYLCEVFHDDEEFQRTAIVWAKEEVQHGMALRRWVELADPTFRFEESFTMFADGHRQPTGIDESIRGSRCGELIARCVVETGTSTYYTAIKERSHEPVLQAICAKIAADEFRHYQLFHTYLKRYQQKDHIGLFKRLSIAWGRVAEIGDNELAFALFSSYHTGTPRDYDQQLFSNHYLAYVCRLYDRRHIERMSAMVLKVVGIAPHGLLSRVINKLLWRLWIKRATTLAQYKVGSQPYATDSAHSFLIGKAA